MLEIIKKIFQKKTAFIIVFLSAIFILPISANALGIITNRHVNLHDNFFEYNEDTLNSSYKTAYINAVNFVNTENLTDYLIFPWGANKVAIFTSFNDITSGNDIDFSLSMRWYSSANKEFTLNINNITDMAQVEHYVATQYNVTKKYDLRPNFCFNPGKHCIINGFGNRTIQDFYSNTSLNIPLKCKGKGCNVDLDFLDINPYYFESIKYRNVIYNKGDILDFLKPPDELIFDLDGDVYKDGSYKGLNFYFKKPADGDLKFKIELIENGSDKPSFDFVSAFDLSFLNLADTLERIKQCEYNPDGFGGCFTGSGGTFGGGGGGGRFGDDDDYCGFSSFPLNVNTTMTSEYGIFTILPCELHKQKTPDYFKTEQIKITTNAEVYLTYKELEEEFLTNPPDWFDWGGDPVNNIKTPLDIFKIINQYMTDNRVMINEVSKVSNSIFSGFNSEIRAFITASYSLVVLVGIAILVRK